MALHRTQKANSKSIECTFLLALERSALIYYAQNGGEGLFNPSDYMTGLVHPGIPPAGSQWLKYVLRRVGLVGDSASRCTVSIGLYIGLPQPDGQAWSRFFLLPRFHRAVAEILAFSTLIVIVVSIMQASYWRY
jgi:hypothetical protein